jgi:tRNA-specific 2-thiouridylase
MLTQAELARIRFPVGELTKPQVRRIAAGMGMRTAKKPESMEICFVGDGDYREFLEVNAPEVFTPGVLVDASGRVVGEHRGIVDFTVGQRRGLGIPAAGEPRFVIRIDADTHTVVLGSREELEVSKLSLTQVTWSNGTSASQFLAQYRAHGEAVEATLEGDTLRFQEPQRAVAPGQTVAFYHDDRVLGGALIASATR